MVDGGGLTPTKGIVYYSCLTHRDDIEQMCRTQLALASDGLELITVSRSAMIPFGENYVLDAPRSPYTMHKQVVMGLEHSRADIVFLCESDVLYHPSHFDVSDVPRDTFVYNTNVWRVRYPDGLAVWSDNLQQVSGVCAYRETLLDFYTQRVTQLASGFNRHYEPGVKQSVGSRQVVNRLSVYPNICIRHDKNLTPSKWSPDEFRDKRYAQGWKQSDYVPGWGYTQDLFARENV